MATDSTEICNVALSKIGASAITSLTANLCKEDRLCNRFYAKFRDELLMKYPWNFAKKATPLNRTDLYDTSTGYDDYVTITNIATSNPVAVTAVNNYGSNQGYTILISEIVGTDELNDLVFEVGYANAASFSLLGVDGGKYSTYVSGGKAIRVEAMTMYRDGYTYVIPTDCLRPLALDSGMQFEMLETRLLTQDEAPIFIYIKQITDTTKFSPLFEECLVSKLAAELCMPLLGAKEGIQMRRAMEMIYRQALIEAQKVECNSIYKQYTYLDNWVTARY